jgi:hypothetical protein
MLTLGCFKNDMGDGLKGDTTYIGKVHNPQDDLKANLDGLLNKIKGRH